MGGDGTLRGLDCRLAIEAAFICSFSRSAGDIPSVSTTISSGAGLFFGDFEMGENAEDAIMTGLSSISTGEVGLVCSTAAGGGELSPMLEVVAWISDVRSFVISDSISHTVGTEGKTSRFWKMFCSTLTVSAELALSTELEKIPPSGDVKKFCKSSEESVVTVISSEEVGVTIGMLLVLGKVLLYNVLGLDLRCLPLFRLIIECLLAAVILRLANVW